MKKTAERPKALLLLRVSTAKQVNGNDDCPLPVQREKCLAICRDNGWDVIDEIIESVSAFKNPIYKRKAILGISNRAENKEFDILVVFKIDRIGRTGIETINYMTELFRLGIRVWSATEGEYSNKTSESELMLIIKGWSAKAESTNISIRVKSSMEFLVKNGGYRGGEPMFGYKLVPTGEVSKKGRLINDFRVDPGEAEIVREIFRKAAYEGKGTTQLANYLNENGVKTHKGALFQASNVMRILKNRLYIGYQDTKDIKGPYQEKLRIVDDETFDRVQRILRQRSKENEEKRTISLNTCGSSLLSGNVFCAHCGGRITASSSHRNYVTAKGEERKYVTHKYVCGNRANRRCGCDGQMAYYSEDIDAVVASLLRCILSNISDSPESEAVERSYGAKIKALRETVRSEKKQLEKLSEKEERLTAEIADVLIGESGFSEEQLQQALTLISAQIEETERKLKEHENRLNNLNEERKATEDGYKQLMTWRDEFDTASIERRKMIVSEVFERIELRKGYIITIEINDIYRPFLEQTDCEEFFSAYHVTRESA